MAQRKKIDPLTKVDRIKELRAAGKTVAEVGTEIGVSARTLQDWRKKIPAIDEAIGPDIEVEAATVYDPDTHPQRAAYFRGLGYTEADTAKAIEISESTLHAWKKAHPEFLDALRQTKERIIGNTLDALYRRATEDRTVTETTVEFHYFDNPEYKTDKTKPPRIKIAVKEMQSTKVIARDPGAGEKVLRAYDPKRFNSKEDAKPETPAAKPKELTPEEKKWDEYLSNLPYKKKAILERMFRERNADVIEAFRTRNSVALDKYLDEQEAQNRGKS